MGRPGKFTSTTALTTALQCSSSWLSCRCRVHDELGAWGAWGAGGAGGAGREVTVESAAASAAASVAAVVVVVVGRVVVPSESCTAEARSCSQQCS